MINEDRTSVCYECADGLRMTRMHAALALDNSKYDK